MKRYKCSDLGDKAVFVPQPRPVFPTDYIPYSYFYQPYSSGYTDPGTFADQQILYEPYWSITASPQTPTPTAIIPAAYRGVDIPITPTVVNTPIEKTTTPLNDTSPPLQMTPSSFESFPFTSSEASVNPMASPSESPNPTKNMDSDEANITSPLMAYREDMVIPPPEASYETISDDHPQLSQQENSASVHTVDPPITIADDTPYYQEPASNASPLMAYREDMVTPPPETSYRTISDDHTQPSQQGESASVHAVDPPITIADNTPYYHQEPYGMTSPLMSYQEDTNSLPPSATFHISGAVLENYTLPLVPIQISDTDVTFEKPGTIHLKAGYAYQITYFIQSVLDTEKEIEICIPVIGAKGPGCKTSGHASFLLEAEENVQFSLHVPQEANAILSGRVTILKRT